MSSCDVSLANDEEAEHLIYQLGLRGYQTLSVMEQSKLGRLATARLELSSHAVTDILFASSGVEAEIVAGALLLEVVPDLTMPVAQIGDLITLKVLSSSVNRPHDELDLRNLLLVASDDDLARARWLAELIMQRGTHRERDVLELLQESRAAVIG